MGVSLLDACFFDVRDRLLLESLLCGLGNGSFAVGYGPTQGVLNKVRSDKNVKLAEKIGQDILDYGVSPNAENIKRFLFTNQDEGSNPPTTKRNSDEGLLIKRMSAATVESTKLKVRNTKNINAGKREYCFQQCEQQKKLHSTNMLVTNLFLP